MDNNEKVTLNEVLFNEIGCVTIEEAIKEAEEKFGDSFEK